MSSFEEKKRKTEEQTNIEIANLEKEKKQELLAIEEAIAKEYPLTKSPSERNMRLNRLRKLQDDANNPELSIIIRDIPHSLCPYYTRKGIQYSLHPLDVFLRSSKKLFGIL